MKWTIVRYLPVFACGLVSFHLYERIAQYAAPRREVGTLLLGLSFVLLAMLLGGSLPFLVDSDALNWKAIIFGALVIGLAIHPTPLLVNPATLFLGKLSFSLYLIHPILLHALSPLYQEICAWPAPLSFKWLASLGLTLGFLVPLSYISFQLVEQPGIRLGSRLVKRLGRPTHPADAKPGAAGGAR